MILDEQGLFSNKQAITASAASTNVLDFGKREIAFGTPVDVFIQISDDFNNLTNLNIKVQTSDKETFTTSVTLIEQTIPLSDLKKGAVSTIKFIPKGNLGYMRLYYTVTGTAPTKGSVTAGIADGNQESFHNV
ncbi:hypothetical protein IJ182_01280 [bacterium]|nr:hypothetical protein [bacterium]